MIVIVDFGSQTTHLIARRLRQMNVEVEIVAPESAFSRIEQEFPTGIILSGGPSSVYESGAPTVPRHFFDLPIPMLGICYGWQLMAQSLGGKVIAGNREYGPTELARSTDSPLLAHIDHDRWTVWMSHGDEVLHIPENFTVIASTPTVPAAAVENRVDMRFGLQFHPEVDHSEHGTEILKNFAESICGLEVSERVLTIEPLIKAIQDQVSQQGSGGRVIAAVSGGVDSTVASALVARAIGKKFTPIYCDNGLMRPGTTEAVQHIFGELLEIEPVIIDCKDEFLGALKGVTDPEKKRTIIGNLYVKMFERAAAAFDDIEFLVQGTIYSDVIESQGTTHASKIKSHHNVGGLPENMQWHLLEPVRELYKDEVRAVGRLMGLPAAILARQPFPGPGQAIRILGEVTPERLARQQQADAIVLEVLRETGWYEKVFQSFPVMTGAISTAVKGDGRVHGEVVGLRIYDSNDIMTAGWTRLPYDVLQQISSRIVNEVEGVSRVAYDITTKPPATMEWE